MRRGRSIAVIIPAIDEAQSIGNVLDAIPEWVDDVIVADNGSKDRTRDVAEEHGARVVREPRRGYGSACLRGMAALESPHTVVFLDGDFSDHPGQMDRLVDPILDDEADMVIGSRVLGNAEKGALTPQAYYGNKLACFLMRLFWGARYTDLGPFRAIRYTSLMELGMTDPDYGWTVEMQIKAALHKLRTAEAPVDYRKRIGRSKVSGTVLGVIGAGYKILTTIFLSAFRHYARRPAKQLGNRRVIVFTRYPEPGKTKTRLIPELGPQGAADLQHDMTEHMVDAVSSCASASVEIHYSGGTEEAMTRWLGEEATFREQGEGDLGDRMAGAFSDAFAEGVEHAAIIGIDCPDVTARIVDAALDRLRDCDLVLGPATDGGYYLIAVRAAARDRAMPALFETMEWGTDRVLEETTRRAKRANLRVALLAPLDDVDRPEDIVVWERSRALETKEGVHPYVTVIVPTLNEADMIEETLGSIGRAEDREVIVVDGGSTDSTVAIAENFGATVLETSGGRAAQMNIGSAKARGDVLLFLHGDTRLPAGYVEQIREVLARPKVAGGAFRFSTDSDSWGMGAVVWGVNIRSQWLQAPYGDQGLFLSKNTFRELGGFAPMPIMEDFEFVRRLRRRGRIALAGGATVTSARRWRRLGPWRTVIYNQLIIGAYYAGVPVERLAKFYRRSKKT